MSLIFRVLTWTDSYWELWPRCEPSRRERADLFLGTMWKQENFKGWEVRLAELSFTRWALVDSRKPKELWTFVFPGQTCFIKTHGYTSLLGFLADLWGTCTFEVNDSTGHSMFVFIWPSMEPPNHAKPDSLLVKLTTQRSGKKGRQPSIYSEYGNLDPREAEPCQERSRRWSQWCISISQGIRAPHVTLMVDVVEESARIAGLGLAPTKNVFERVFCQTFASHAYRI